MRSQFADTAGATKESLLAELLAVEGEAFAADPWCWRRTHARWRMFSCNCGLAFLARSVAAKHRPGFAGGHAAFSVETGAWPANQRANPRGPRAYGIQRIKARHRDIELAAGLFVEGLHRTP
jgi:hypothetical protein